jgi:hypothetical protein
MFFRLSDRDNVICITPLGVHYEHHDAVPQSDGLKPHFTIGIAPVFTANRESRENRLRADKVEPVFIEVEQELVFVVGNHEQIVDAFLRPVKQIEDAKRKIS